MLWFWINDSLSSSFTGVFLSFQVLKHPDKKFRVGQALRATVVGPDSSKAFLCLSLIGVGMKQCLVGERKWREGVGWVFNFCSSWRTPSVLESSESLVWDLLGTILLLGFALAQLLRYSLSYLYLHRCFSQVCGKELSTTWPWGSWLHDRVISV